MKMQLLRQILIPILLIALISACSEPEPITESLKTNVPDKPIGLLPVNAEVCSDFKEVQGFSNKATIYFNWSRVENATSYLLQVFESDMEVNSTTSTGTKAELILEKGKSYSWTITAKNDAGETMSDFFSFSTPGNPIGNYAPYAAKITVEYDSAHMLVSWIGSDEDEDLLMYDVKVFGAGELIFEIEELAALQIEPLSYLPNTAYKVEVVSKDANGNFSESKITVSAPDDQNSVEEFIITIEGEDFNGYIDEATSTILVEFSEGDDLENLPITISVSENAEIDESFIGAIDLSNGSETFTVIAENGDEREFRVSAFTNNLLKNPLGINDGEFWEFNGITGTTGVDLKENGRNEFYIFRYDDEAWTNIRQTVNFNTNYGNKYILFLGDLTTEKTVESSITRHPYFWGHQNGPFNFDDDPYEEVIQGGMRHQAGANVWEIVYDANLLLEGVESVTFQMGQAGQNGDPWDGTKCMLRDVEVRVFETFEDAEIYVSNLYLKQPRKSMEPIA